MTNILLSDRRSWRYDLDKLVVLCSLIICGFWIIGAAYFHFESSAGRGGSIVVAISLYFLFGGNIGTRIYGFLSAVPPGRPQSGEQKIDAIEHTFSLTSNINRQRNNYLAFLSLVGTVSWGFGDIAARHVPSGVLRLIVHQHDIVCPEIRSVCRIIRSIVEI